MNDSVKLLELMASKICHDLISPVGAVANGVEFLEEMGEDAGEDVTDLISFSAGQASAKLQTLRLAYGAGGGDSSIKPEDVHKIFGAFIDGENRITQDWDPYTPLGPDMRPEGFAKILINTLLLTTESLPKGGHITVAAGDDAQVIITGEGENAGLKDGFLNAIENTIDMAQMEPRLVHPYLAGLLAKNYGYTINIEDSQDNRIVLKIRSPDVV
jgi:histidine phosphotransferase ChpT